MDIYTSGDVPECASDNEATDLTLHPDYQLDLSGRLHIFADEHDSAS